MRLTLRTLLAWLDDTLSPSEVREIGKQVAESPFAKELVERLHRVTRQRRLTVPNWTGSDATDPNLVASYLDNELPADDVTEFEKRCLTSDVHLAEVASVHQILSLIGQKAKVPTEARHRMYGLIKGRESVAPKAPRASHAIEPEPVSEPIQPWVTPEPPRRPWIEQFGPAAGVVLLIVLLCVSAWQSLSPPEPVTSDAEPITAKGLAAKNAGKGGETPSKPTQVAIVEHPETPKPQAEPAPQPSKTEAEPAVAKEEMKSEPAPAKTEGEPLLKPDMPPGTIGYAEKPTGVLLRFNRDLRQWEMLTAETPLKDQDRLLSLHPFRSTLTLGTARIDLVGETEVWVLPALSNQAAKVNLVQGRLVLHGTPQEEPFVIQFAKKNVELALPSRAVVGVERFNRRDPGVPVAGDPVLAVFASEGDIGLTAGTVKETLQAPAVVSFDPRSSWTGKEAKPAPSWVIETKPSPYDLQIGSQFQRFFRPDKPVMADLVEASEDDQRDVRRVAISALRAVGDIEMIIPLLEKEENPVSRRAAIAVLRAFLGQGADASKELHAQVLDYYGPEAAEAVEKLLIGFSPKEAREEATFAKLVQFLSAPKVGVRELALDNLQSLTGRDDLAFDPDKPEGKGLKAWKDLLRDHELHHSATPKGAAKPVEPAEKPEQP